MLGGFATQSDQQIGYITQLIGLVKTDLLYRFLIHATRITVRFLARDSKHTGNDSNNSHHCLFQS